MQQRTAELLEHYKEVKRRLWHGNPPKRKPMPQLQAPKPEPQEEPPQEEEKEWAPPPKLPLQALYDDMLVQSGLTSQALSGPNRVKAIVKIRQEFCYRALLEVGATLTQVGKKINRDHTTVLYAVRAHAFENNLPLPAGMRQPTSIERFNRRK